MTEEELEHHLDERLEKLKQKRSGTWQPWPADNNKLTLECYEGEKKEDNYVSKMEIGISIDGGIIDFKNLKFIDWLDVRYGNDQPKDLLGRARLFKEWVAKSCDELFEEYSNSINRLNTKRMKFTETYEEIRNNEKFKYLLLNVKHDSNTFIINANQIYVAETYALGSAVATDGYMVIEEEPAVLDAQIGSSVEVLKCDGLF
nr:hypothetical protein [Tanacetum cinerariifolium]